RSRAAAGTPRGSRSWSLHPGPHLPRGSLRQDGRGRALMNRDLRVGGRRRWCATTVTTGQGTETQQQASDATMDQRFPAHALSLMNDPMRRSGLGQPIEAGGARWREARSEIVRQGEETIPDETELDQSIQSRGIGCSGPKLRLIDAR